MDNLRGAALMVLAMLGFAIEDMFIKLMSDALPVGQILAMLGPGGSPSSPRCRFGRREPLFFRAMLSAPMLLRALGEMIGTLGFVTAIALTPISQRFGDFAGHAAGRHAGCSAFSRRTCRLAALECDSGRVCSAFC